MIVKKGLIYLLYFVIFIFSLVIFIPKINIYYYFENQLTKYEVILSNENIKEQLTTLNIGNIEVYFKNSKVALINKIEFNYDILSPLNIEINIVIENEIVNGKIDLLSKRIIFENMIQADKLGTILSHLNFSYKNGVYLYEY